MMSTDCDTKMTETEGRACKMAKRTHRCPTEGSMRRLFSQIFKHPLIRVEEELKQDIIKMVRYDALDVTRLAIYLYEEQKELIFNCYDAIEQIIKFRWPAWYDDTPGATTELAMAVLNNFSYWKHLKPVVKNPDKETAITNKLRSLYHNPAYNGLCFRAMLSFAKESFRSNELHYEKRSQMHLQQQQKLNNCLKEKMELLDELNEKILIQYPDFPDVHFLELKNAMKNIYDINNDQILIN